MMNARYFGGPRPETLAISQPSAILIATRPPFESHIFGVTVTANEKIYDRRSKTKGASHISIKNVGRRMV